MFQNKMRVDIRQTILTPDEIDNGSNCINMTVRETTDTNPDDDENQPEADQSSLANYYGRNDPTTHETNYIIFFTASDFVFLKKNFKTFFT